MGVVRSGVRAAAVVALCVVLLGGCSDVSDTEDTIAGLFARSQTSAASPRSYVGPGSVDAVTGQIARTLRPIDRRRTGDHEYLQYGDAIVRVDPGGAVSNVAVDDYETGYRRWNSEVSPYWAPRYNYDTDGK